MDNNDSGFDELKNKVDYEIINQVDSNTYEKKKIYSSVPFLVLPQIHFNIRLGSLLPKFVCYVRQLGEQFGDSIRYDLTNKTIRIFVYDDSNNLLVRDFMIVTNTNLSEITYSWKEFDLQAPGTYTCQIEIKAQDGNRLILPANQQKIQLIVS